MLSSVARCRPLECGHLRIAVLLLELLEENERLRDSRFKNWALQAKSDEDFSGAFKKLRELSRVSAFSEVEASAFTDAGCP